MDPIPQDTGRVPPGIVNPQVQKLPTFPKELIASVLLTAGLAVGAAIFAAHTGSLPTWTHSAAQGATIFLSTSVAAQALMMGKLGYQRRKQCELLESIELPPEVKDLPPPRQSRRMAPPRPAKEMNQEELVKALANTRKQDKCYFDLTGTDSLHRLPEIKGSRPHLAVRLPSSQAAAFPEEVRDFLKGDHSAEIFFMVFPVAKDIRFLNLSLHKLVLDNYDPGNPTLKGLTEEGSLRQGQRALENGLETTMTARMFDQVGIDTDWWNVSPVANPNHPDYGGNRKLALKNRSTTFHPSITKDKPPNNMVQFKLKEDAPVSSIVMGAKTEDGRRILVHALIIKDEESDAVRQVLNATRQETLEGFLEGVKQGSLDKGIKKQITRTFSAPSTRPQ